MKGTLARNANIDLGLAILASTSEPPHTCQTCRRSELREAQLSEKWDGGGMIDLVRKPPHRPSALRILSTCMEVFVQLHYLGNIT